MANQQIGVNMKFTADTSQAKNQIQTLQTQLTQAITTASKSDFALNKQLQEAISSAAELKSMLTTATNVNTGNLDLSKFSEGLSRSKSSLKDYAKQLIELGPVGEQAFMTLAKSVVSAEVPAKRTSALLNDIFITLKNTAKWQISSNIMHGFEGALKSAYGYAQDLNKSLNNIRIVTSANIDEMARFAEQANKSAKALSTTTTDYTNASLIYYQQGLSDQEVKERTDITIKMANAAGQSAEIVSDQMTAVWNNFDNGSKSLEYYADVMTALGAATASSTDEIATGLEKFAAISETVGLSYEYATAALATVTDKTRQSADVVGTAFKTMFARIEGLELGETLDDGTDLNQYSEALAKVGVNIKDANGQLKDMDDILNGMADVWETLNRDEQVALAQKVAGVRQYNQLISLMENWDAMQDNLATAQGSEGSLQEQADIYAESWEASRDRVTAAAEDIYTKLLDEDFFIGVNNLLEDTLGGFSRLIDVMGGLPGILTSLGSIATRVFGNQIGNSINNLIYNIGVFTGAAEDNANILRNEMKEAIDIFNKGLESGSSKSLEGEVLKQEIDRTYELQTKVSSLTEEQKQYAQELIKIETQYGKNAVAAQQAAEAASQNQGSQARQMRNAVVGQAEGMDSGDGDKLINDFERTQQYMVKTSQSAAKLKLDIEKALTGKISGTTIIKTLEENIKNLDGNSKTLKGTVTNVNKAINDYKKAIKEAGDNTGKKSQATKDLKMALSGLEITEETLHNIIQETAESVKRSHPDMEVRTQDWIECGEAAMDTAKKEEDASNAETLYQQRIAETSKKLQQGKLAIQSYGQAFVKGAQGLSSLLFGLNSLKSIFDTLNNEELSSFEKITTVMTQLTMAIPSIVSGFSSLGSAVKLVNEAHKTGNASVLAYLLGLKAENLENEKGEKITLRSALAKKLESSSTDQSTISKTANYLITKLLKLETMAFYGVLLLIVAVIGAVAVGIYLMVNRYNEAANASKRAAEQAKIAAEQYEKVKTKYDELKKSLEDYKDAKKALNYLTEGTDEWKEGIIKANEEAQKLIDTYSELQGKYHYNAETKLIDFDKGALEDLEKNQQNIVDNQYANKITTDNSAKMAENRSIIVDTSRENDPSYWDNLKNSVFNEKFGLLIGAGIIGGLVPALIGVAATVTDAAVDTFIQRSNNDEQQNALSNLADQYLETDGNFTEALNNLSVEDQNLINSLGFTTDELKSLCSEMASNTLAIQENNKAIIDNSFTGNKDYDDSLNKKFLNEQLGKDFEDKKETAQGTIDLLSKEEIQEQYAKTQGYTFVESKGDSAVYKDAAGETVTIGNEVAKSYLVQKEALKLLSGDLKDTSEKVNALAREEKILTAQYGDSIEDFEIYKNKLKEKGRELGFEDEEVDEYIQDYGNNQKTASKIELSNKFQSLDPTISAENANQATEVFAQNFTDEQLKMASQIEALSFDDFFRQFEEQLYDNIIDSMQTSADGVQDVINQAKEDGAFSLESLTTLEKDENFSSYLEAMGQSITDFTSANYSERLRIVSSYYTALKATESDFLEESKRNYQEDLTEYQAILDYKKALEDGNTKKVDDIASAFKDIDFEAYADLDISEVESKIDEIQDQISSIEDQQIKMDLEWDTTNAIEAAMKDIASFASMIENDTKQVGNSYLMTAAQAKPWMEMYPELFSNAKVTTDGLISLNSDYVNDFIGGQEEATDASIEANIKQLESRLSELEGEKAAYEADLELAKSNATGKEALSSASAEYLAETREALTQYYMDLGLDETQANAKALEAMGLNEAEYEELVANASSRNAENKISAEEQSAEGQADALQVMGENETEYSDTVADAATVNAENKISESQQSLDSQKTGLEAMGANEVEYSGVVSDVATKNAQNQIKSAEQGASGQTSVLSKLGNRVVSWGKRIGNIFKNVWGALTGKVEWKDVWGAFDGSGLSSSVSVTGIGAADDAGSFKNPLAATVKKLYGSDETGDYEDADLKDVSGISASGETGDFSGADQMSPEAALQTVNAKTAEALETNLADINDRINKITSEINYNRALQNQSLSDYGSTDPTKDDPETKKKDPPAKKEEKDLGKIAERYHEINKEIDAQNHKLKILNKVKSNVHGAEKIKAMAAEKAQLSGLYKNQSDLLDLQKGFLEVDKQNIKDIFGDAAIFDEGDTENLTNYTELATLAMNDLNTARETYNKSKQTEEDKKALEDAEKKYEDVIGVLDQYEETVQDTQKAEEELIDTIIKLNEIDLEAITYMVETNLDSINFSLSILQTQLENIEDQAYSTAAAIAQLGKIAEAQTGENSTSEMLTTQIEEILKNHFDEETMAAFKSGDMDAIASLFDGSGEGIDLSQFSDEEIKTLMDSAQGLQEANKEIDATRDQVFGQVEKAFTEWNDTWDSHLSQFDQVDSVLGDYENIIDLSGYSSQISTDKRKEYNNIKVTNANNKVTSAKGAYDNAKTILGDSETNLKNAQKNLSDVKAAQKLAEDKLKEANASGDKKKISEAQEAFDLATDSVKAAEKDVKEWEDIYKTSQENVIKYQNEFTKSWQDALQEARDTFLKNTELELKDLEKKMAGTYGNLDEMQKSFDKSQEVDERYLDDYEKLYELNKLNRDLEKQLDGTSGIKAKEKLLKLQEKINRYQAEGVEMSKYDLEYLQKEYDLELAKIAMEEAQNAKSQVRMTRDSEGNYSYTYAADESQQEEAAQNYEDKLYEQTSFNEQYQKESASKIISTQQEMLDALAEINQKAAEGLYSSDEEYKKALADTQTYYTSLLSYYSSEVDKASLNNTIIYGREYASYSKYVDDTLSEGDRLLAAQEGQMAAAAAEVKKLEVQRDASLSHLQYLRDTEQISNEEYLEKKATTNKTYATQISSESIEAEKTTQDSLVILRDANLISQEEYEKSSLEATQGYHAATVAASAAAKDAELEVVEEKYRTGQIKAEEYKQSVQDINDEWDPILKDQEKTAQDEMTSQFQTNYVDKMVGSVGDVVTAELGIETSFGQILPGLSEKYSTASGYAADMAKTLGDPTKEGEEGGILGGIASSYVSMQGAINEAMDNAGIDMENAVNEESGAAIFAQGIDELLMGEDGVAADAKAAADSFGGLKEKTDALPSTLDGLLTFQTTYGTEAETTKRKNDALITSLELLFKTSADGTKNTYELKYKYVPPENKEPEGEDKEYELKYKYSGPTGEEPEGEDKDYELKYKYKTVGKAPTGKDQTYTITYKYVTEGKPPQNSDLANEAAQIIQGVHYGSIPKDKVTDNWPTTAKKLGYSDKAIELALKAINDSKPGQGFSYYYEKALALVDSYDTGGYTGEWGDDGRLAMLHQKELILNAEDTENILTAVSMIREIANMIDFSSYQQSLMSGLSMLTANATIATGAQQSGLQQHIEIFAEFPDATDHSEIELAFQNIVNAASQYANRAY